MCWKLAGSIWHWVFVGFRGNRAFSICQLRKISGRGIETTHDNMVTPTLSHHSLSDVVEKVVGFLLRGLGVGVSSMAIERTAATWILAVSHCEGGHSRGPSSNCSYLGTKGWCWSSVGNLPLVSLLLQLLADSLQSMVGQVGFSNARIYGAG